MENWPLVESEKLGNNYTRTDYEWFVMYANLYVKYISAYKKLEETYDQMVHT